ncbi:MAG: hypothetical protein GXO29_05925 [Thermotogae bacterium]|nr:hypothetical protein [Thermotogota bacterium]
MGIYIVLALLFLILWLNNLCNYFCGTSLIVLSRDWPLLVAIVLIWAVIEDWKSHSARRGSK